MATVTRSASASPDTNMALTIAQVAGIVAGADIDAAAPCYIASDGFAYMSTGAAANAAARCRGFSAKAVKAGEPVDLLGEGARFNYGTALTPGADLFVSATAGRLDDVASTGGTVAVAFAVSATDVVVRTLT